MKNLHTYLNSNTRQVMPIWLILISLVILLSGCYGDQQSDKPVPVLAPIDMSGVWAGTWSGYDPTFGGYISGNWEVDLTLDGASVAGDGTLSGDVDCSDGEMTGSMSKQYVITGTLDRLPCGSNEWLITSLSLLNREVSGIWTKSTVGSKGDFAGNQISKPDSPKIRFFYPPGGLPGTIVSITGDRFASVPSDNTVYFGGISVASIVSSDEKHIAMKVPAGTSIAPITVTVSSGAESKTGRSALSFNSSVTHPLPETINMTISGVRYGSRDIAFLPNGRRAFVTYGHHNGYYVTMIDVASASKLGSNTYIDYDAQSVIASPDNKYVYVTTASKVYVLDAGLNRVVNRIPVSSGNTLHDNPHGLAITPDGNTLIIAANQFGGGVSIMDIESETINSYLKFGADNMPYGVTVSPDGLYVYVTLHGLDQVREYSLDTYALTNTFDVGAKPTGLTIMPDGSRLYVTNTADNTVSVIDLDSDVLSSTIPVGEGPKGIAISPDGLRIYTADYISNTVSIIDTSTDTLEKSINNVFGPISVSVMPDGSRAYVATSNSVQQIAGPITLTTYKSGGGLGTIKSTPEGIFCGEKCRAAFPTDSNIKLQASASKNYRFEGWSGNCVGSDSVVTVKMNGVKNCTAKFVSEYTNTGGGSSGSSGSRGGYDYNRRDHCFIATAAYGSFLDPHVETLRSFRDEYLLTNETGAALVEWYYANSPPAARYISEHSVLRIVVRLLLTPVVYIVMFPKAVLILFTSIVMIAIMRKRKREEGRKKWG